MQALAQVALSLRALFVGAGLAVIGGCTGWGGEEHERKILFSRNGVEMYAGLEPDAAVAGVLEFDTPVTVLDTHRSFVLIRTPDQLEGWAPRDLLLDAELRDRLRSLTRRSQRLPSQGRAHAKDTLNVHLEPYRWSPTFYQLAQDEGFELLDRALVERLPASAATATVPPAPTGLDHWHLVRVPGIGEAGWLLGNMVYPGLPLEVAMLADGRPTVAYFQIGAVEDESLGESKPTWLWAQATPGDAPSDFDRIQVMQWDGRRNRYLVIRRHSDLVGYLPIEIQPDFRSERGVGTWFRFFHEKAGRLYTRAYLYVGRRVYPLGEEPVQGVPPYFPDGGFRKVYERPT